MCNDIPSAPREWRVRTEPIVVEDRLTCENCGLGDQRPLLPPPTLKGDGSFQHSCPCGAVHGLTSKRLARECDELRKMFGSWLPEAPAGNLAGQFPPEKHGALAAAFVAAEPIQPGKIEIPGEDGKIITVSRASALVWALGELYSHFRHNQLTESELVPTPLFNKFHAIAAAADKLLKALGADQSAARFGLSEQIREGLKHFAQQDAKEAGGFRDHPPEIQSVTMGDEKLRFTEFHDDRQLQDNIEGVFQIRRWARQAEEVAKRKQKCRLTDSDQAAYAAMEKGPEFSIYDEIFEIWEKVLGKRVSATVNPIDGAASGPLIDFTRRCLALLGESTLPTGSAIRERARRYLRKAVF